MTKLQALKEKYQKFTCPCEICGGEQSKTYQRYGRVAEPGVYGDMPISICEDCGFKMQNPRFEDGFYIDYYESLYRAVAFGATRPSDEYIAQQKSRGKKVLQFVKERLEKSGRSLANGTMLDHGCASGATMLGWRDDGWTTHGIDPHGPSVKEAKLLGLDVEVGAGEELPFEDEKFDLVLSLGSTEHSYNLEKTMREINRTLKTNGLLIIRWRSDEIFGSPIEYFNHNHYRFFTRNSWRLCLKRFGFKADVMSNERVEGWDSYEYIIASKIRKNDQEITSAGLLEGEILDDPEVELDQIRTLRKDYYDRCKRFITLSEEFNDRPDALIDYVRSSNSSLKWGWLGGKPVEVVARALKEANIYICEYESGNTV